MATRKLHKYTEEVNVGWGGYVLVKYCRLMVEVFIKFCIKNIYKETYFSLYIYIKNLFWRAQSVIVKGPPDHYTNTSSLNSWCKTCWINESGDFSFICVAPIHNNSNLKAPTAEWGVYKVKWKTNNLKPFEALATVGTKNPFKQDEAFFFFLPSSTQNSLTILLSHLKNWIFSAFWSITWKL